MRRLLRWALGPAFWITVVQTAWTVSLVFWIVYFVKRHQRLPNEGWGPLVAGILMLSAVLAGVVAIVVHFARQVALNRAVKDFVSRVSHDLRSPLAAVKLNLETVALRDLDDEQKRSCLASALKELGRLEAGIEDVLTAARIDRRGVAVADEPLDLGSFVGAYLEGKRAQVDLQGASLDARAPLPALQVRGDAGLLRRLLDNLVDNAVLHCQRGVRILVGLERQADCAVLVVQDDGPGLPRREWRRVFRMFHRASARGTRGSGLGLFIVEGIARAHGGRAWVESAAGANGCTFRVALPLAAGARP